jgi:transposase
MNFLKFAVGLDVAMETFDACLSVINDQQQVTVKARFNFPNNQKGFQSLLAWVSKNAKLSLPVIYLMEATGIYYENLAWYLHHNGCNVSVVLPNKAKKYKAALGLKSKTDRIDARGLAQMACEQSFTAWKPLSNNLYTLRLISRQIQSICEQSTALSNQLHALQYGMLRDKAIEKMLASQIALLQKHNAKLKLRLRSMIASDQVLSSKFEKICKIKGLGWESLAVIVAETNGFASFENSPQLVSYAGYDVVANESGKHKGKTKISKKGNSRIRRCLHFPAFNVVKYNVGSFKELYDRVYEKRKIKMVAYTAVQKKLLIIIYALWKNNQDFIDKNEKNKSGDAELAPSFAAAPKELEKINPGSTRVKQDRHPSKPRRMPSFAENKVRKKSTK